MNQFAAALSQHPVASHAVGETAGQVLDQLEGENPDLLVLFASPHFVGAMEDVASTLRNLLEPGTLLGVTASSIIGGAQEVEEEPALSVFAAQLPTAGITSRPGKLGGRPYDLRHAAVSTWLNAGVEATRVAEWAGHSVAVLLRVYAKCLDGGEQAARAKVQQAMNG